MKISHDLTLRQLRELSGHSAAWCADNIAQVSLRSWNYWEAGAKQGSPVQPPEDVMTHMHALAEAVQSVLSARQGKVTDTADGHVQHAAHQ